MKRIVLTFGLIAGAFFALVLTISMVMEDHVSATTGYIFGYATMVLAFLMVYFGIRSYRDNVGGGVISYWRGFAVGISITLIASACYVASWEIVYRKFAPDFYEKYAAQMIARARTSGAPQAVIDKKTTDAAQVVEWSRNPFMNVAMTFIEPFPVGLLFTLASAGMLRRKKRGASAGEAPERSAVGARSTMP
ncbi:MAG: DUF4199 domain-containing protein [Gemmatimonadaceae bacterium]